jgi:hypothetical protein
VGAVLTVAAAGSESSPTAVITDEGASDKRSASSNLIIPRFAILDPELTFGLPSYPTACGACDIMSHVMERYFVRTEDVELSDRLCEATLRTVISRAPTCLSSPEDYAARAELLWAGTIAHNGILGAGRGGDWASHRIEHELSGLYDVAHGAGLAVVLPAWMRQVRSSHPARFARYAVKVWDAEADFSDVDSVGLQGIERTEAFFRSLGLPTRLRDLGIGRERFAEIAVRATAGGPIGSIERLDAEAVTAILESAL